MKTLRLRSILLKKREREKRGGEEIRDSEREKSEFNKVEVRKTFSFLKTHNLISYNHRAQRKIKQNFKPHTVAHVCAIPATRKSEAGGSQVQGQPRQYRGHTDRQR